VSAVADPSRSVFVKQAPEFIKCLGPAAQLSSARIALESRALLVQNSLAPAFTPRHLHFDAARATIVMEDLRDHVMLRDELLAGRVHEGDARALGQFMARTHALSWRGGGVDTGAGGAAYAERFANELLCGITSEYVFRKPFDAAEPSNRHSPQLNALVLPLRQPGSPAAAGAAALEQIFRARKQCLIHGDLHAGSVMVARGADTSAAAYANGRLRVIDAEFACVGPASFDAGLLLAAFALAHHRHAALGHAEVVEAIERAVRALWAEYTQQRTALLGADESARVAVEGLREAVGFMGAELTRRVIGAAHVPDLDGIADERTRVAAERAALASGVEALTTWERAESIESVLALLRPFGQPAA
jgi:5-methylthioribose kinase